MNDEQPVFLHTETAQTWLMVALAILGGLTVAMVTGRLGTIGFVALLGLAIAVLLSHSLSVRVDAQQIEVRLGNGMLRRRADLDDLRAVQWFENAPRLGWGRRADRRRVFGLGGTSVVELEWQGEDRWIIALRDGGPLAARLRMLLRMREIEPFPDDAQETP